MGQVVHASPESLSLSAQLQLAQAVRASRRTTRRVGDVDRLQAMTARRAFKDATKILRDAAVSL